MSSLKFWVCLIFIFLSILRSQPRPLQSPFPEGRKLSESFQTVTNGTQEAYIVGQEKEEPTPSDESKRLSPSGPDPQHHSMDPS
uniref:Uncharacterized protein n=1 Tax=Nelumbo nucifera TaxID=4432 RepID=A0A822XLK4_NELNU|nr:TPA_asm: hypothetical protein HUJ06_022610 [Nelumbo nucifera]